MFIAIRLIESLSLLGVEQTRDHPDGARSIKHVHGAPAELGGDLHGCMLGAGRRASDQQRECKPPTLHFLGDEDHLVEGRGNEPA